MKFSGDPNNDDVD